MVPPSKSFLCPQCLVFHTQIRQWGFHSFEHKGESKRLKLHSKWNRNACINNVRMYTGRPADFHYIKIKAHLISKAGLLQRKGFEKNPFIFIFIKYSSWLILLFLLHLIELNVAMKMLKLLSLKLLCSKEENHLKQINSTKRRVGANNYAIFCVQFSQSL